MPVHWIELNLPAQLFDLLESCEQKELLFFKHSTRCSISALAKNRLEKLPDTKFIYYIDVIKNRQLSNCLAEHFNIRHESPQLIKIHNGQAVMHASHNAINPTLI
jgi:bacillithiol system protein YtxJ